MTFKMAPMEGLTDCYFRKIQSRHFPKADVYYTPFLSPTSQHLFTPKEKREIDPANNEGIQLIPQVIGHDSEDFIWAAKELAQMGYGEVNLNLGCPSGTVVKKKKGSGLLAYPIMLKNFLNEIFSETPIPISIKTRIGLRSADDFEELMEIYNQYPIKELTIHPRFQSQMYKGLPDLKAWELALGMSKNPLCYNGNILNKEDYEAFHQQYPQVEELMIGRGMIANPNLIGELKGGTALTLDALKDFHEDLYETTKVRIPHQRQALMHMKESWYYMCGCFDEAERVFRLVRKATSHGEYLTAVRTIFDEYRLCEKPGFIPKTEQM